MFTICRNGFILVSLLYSALFAGPRIEITPKKYQCGTVAEGKTDKLIAHFSVINSGDSLLLLTKVRPGCGCTVVKYDSLIAPGKSVTIDAQVNITGYHSGSIVKSITVTSNAVNEPTIRLDIAATIQALVELSENYIDLNCALADSPHVIVVASRKADLKITKVSARPTFMPDSTGKNSPVAQSIKYRWASTDSVRSDGCHIYKLSLFAPRMEKTTAAVFSISTNHPDKKEIILSGQLKK